MSRWKDWVLDENRLHWVTALVQAILGTLLHYYFLAPPWGKSLAYVGLYFGGLLAGLLVLYNVLVPWAARRLSRRRS